MADSEKSFKKFLLLWSGQFVSAIGSGLTSFGLGVYVFQQTGKVSAMALVTLLAFMPSLILSAGAGVLADRYDRRMLMMVGDGFSALGLVFILLCMMNGGAQVWQICVGVTISSVFSSLLEPAYKATITDLLTEEQYTKASGLVGIAGSAKYLISPILAGFLLSIAGIEWLLLLDIGTFFLTVATTLVVRKGLVRKSRKDTEATFLSEFHEGWKSISQNKGVLILVLMASVVTFSTGFLQTLFTPMFLAFTNSSVLGFAETFCACGMLVSSIFLGCISIKKGYVKMLSASLFGLGIFMIGFGLRENLWLICISGFLIFLMLPFANTSLDFLIRTNIDNDVQGRAWGLIGVISQLGYILAYAISGVLADYVFTPMLLPNGALASTIGQIIGTGSGRGTGFLIIVAGMLLCGSALILFSVKAIRKLEKGVQHVL